jgi:hypothetical protein
MNPDEQRIFFQGHCIGKNWLGVDFSKFDQTLPSWLIWEVFDVIKSWFPKSCGREIDWIRYNFIHTRMLLPGGEMFQKHRGVPSGSYFTQIVDSMCNMLMLLTYLVHRYGIKDARKEIRSQKPRSRKHTITTLGDDGLLFTYSRIDVNDLSSYLMHNFGVIVQPEKSDQGSSLEYPHFLKRFWGPRYQYRNYVETWINTCHPEHKREYITYSPWHIIFAIYLTYEGTMKEYFSRTEIVSQLRKEGYDSSSFDELRPQDLPGSVAILEQVRPGYLKKQFELSDTSNAA